MGGGTDPVLAAKRERIPAHAFAARSGGALGSGIRGWRDLRLPPSRGRSRSLRMPPPAALSAVSLRASAVKAITRSSLALGAFRCSNSTQASLRQCVLVILGAPRRKAKGRVPARLGFPASRGQPLAREVALVLPTLRAGCNCASNPCARRRFYRVRPFSAWKDARSRTMASTESFGCMPCGH